VIVDTSAIVAILRDEPERERLERALADADACAMSAPTRVELAAVLVRSLSPTSLRRADRFLDALGLEIAAFDAAQAALAADAYRDFGRGSGHPAQLNLGDTYSYALAIARDEQLLFVGDDFGHTDVRIA